MALRIERLSAAIAIALLAACGGSSTSGPSPTPTTVLVVAANPASVVADGVQAVTVTVTGPASGAVSLSTNRGAFASGFKGIQVPALPATVTLYTCDGTLDPSCPGTAVIRAGDAGGSYGETTVTFTASPTPGPTCTTCGSSACVGEVCDTSGRTCSAETPSTCSVCPPGTITCADASTALLALEAASTRIPADGVATTLLTATLTLDGEPLAGKTISFTSSLAGTRLSTPAVTDANGKTTVTFTSIAEGGEATITATFAASATTTIRGQTVVVMPRLAQLTVAAYQHEVLGARDSDFQERSIVAFQALDTASLPYPPGLTVSFTHESLARSFIGESEANCTAAFPLCQATGVTDAEGKVMVTLTSGTAAGVVSIAGGATAGGLSASAVAHRLAIVGAKASGAHVVMDCGNAIEPALLFSDCANSHLVKTVECTVSLRDRFQNVVGRSTRVQVFAEAGSTGMSAVTPMYETGEDPVGQIGLGIAALALRTDGKLPIDVAPLGGEFALTYRDACGTLTHNPRDGLVTMIGMVNGEEGFVDWDGNGRYDAGEPYIDVGEPYIDANDDGTWESGEFFVDVNSNGTYDGPNAAWDRNAVLWTETRVLFTGHSFTIADGATGLLAGSQFFQVGTLPEPVTASPFSVRSATPGPATSQRYALALGDVNFNPLPSAATYTVEALNGNVTAEFERTPAPPFGPGIGLGISFTQQYCTKPRWEQIVAGETCGNVCPSNGSTTNSPCYVVTNVGDCTAGSSPRTGCSGFSNASTGTVVITGVTAGADVVEASTVIEGVTSSTSLGGTVLP